MTVSGGGGACTPVPDWPDSVAVRLPVWLPDGHHFASRGASRWVVYTLDGEAPRPFIDGARDVQFIAPDLAVYARVGRSGAADLIAQRFDRGRMTLTGTPTTLAEGVRTAGSRPSYSVTATALAYLGALRADVGPLVLDARGVIRDSIPVEGIWTWRFAREHQLVALGGVGLWVYDLSRRTSIRLKPRDQHDFPVWSPGDSLMAVAVSDSAGCRVERIRVGDGADTALIDQSAAGRCFHPADWSADGRLLVLTKLPSGQSGSGELWTYAFETGVLERLLSVEGAVSAGVVSPDMRWLAYVTDETGELEVYVRSFRGSGTVVRASTAGGAAPRWRRDGRALFYERPDGTIEQVAVAAGLTLELGTPAPLFRAPRWSARLFADQEDGVQVATTYDVSPDGQRFLVRQRAEESPAAVLLVNWQSLLDRASQPGGR